MSKRLLQQRTRTRRTRTRIHIPVMQSELTFIPPGEAANTNANATKETGGALRERLGVQPRTFQKSWKSAFGYSFDSRRVVTNEEREAMEARFKLAAKKEVVQIPDLSEPDKKRVLEVAQTIENQGPKAEIIVKKVASKSEVLAAWAMFLTPTLASIRNTSHVSGGFSGDFWTALLITATISLTGILWIASRKRVGWGDLAGIFVFQLFEAFSNMVQVFKNLMGSMSYGISTVSGKPSELLDMVATVTGSDHQDTAVILAGGVAMFVLSAQLKGLLLIKSQKA